jgi:hypothetical protein
MLDPLVPNDISEGQLKWGYWFVTHKLLLRKILVVVLIVLNAGFFGFSGYRFVLDLLDAPIRAQMIKSLTTNYLNPDLTASEAPRSLVASNVQVLVSTGKYDFVSTVKNVNQNYYAHFSYRFVAGDFATAGQQDFILPGEEKFLANLAVTATNRPAGATMEISNVSWQRVNKHIIADWPTFASQHLNFPVTDILYTPGIEIAVGKPLIGRTTFTISNNTGYGYYNVQALVLMYRGAALAAVNLATIPTLAPGETKTGGVTWYEDFGAISQIKVFPTVDITDDASYLRAP